MSKFTKSFSLRILLEGGLFVIALFVVMQMFSHNIIIDSEKNITAAFYAVPIVALGIIFPLFMLFIAVHNTRVIRYAEYSLSNSSEFAFYRNFILIMLLVNVIIAVLVYLKSLPYFQTALDDAFWKIRVMDYSDEYTADMQEITANLKNGYVSAYRNAFIIQWVVCAVVMFVNAGRLVKVYQTRPVNKDTERRMRNGRKKKKSEK